MDASHTVCIMLVFIASFLLLVQTGLSDDVTDPPIGSPIEYIYAERPLSSYENYLYDCTTQLYPICGEEIFSTVFFGNTTYSNVCCLNLVNDLGKLCHDGLVKYILTSPKFQKNKVSIWERSEQVWNDCASRAQDITPVEAEPPVDAEAPYNV